MTSRVYGFPVYRKAKSIGANTVFTLPSTANRNTTIGDWCNIGGTRIIGQGEVVIGNYCQFAPELLIFTQSHNYKGELLPYDNTNIVKPVKIDDFVWIGQRVTILPGTHIGEGAIIQAGSVVHGEIPRCAIAGGNPARVFSYREGEHFERLKKEGKFIEISF